MFENVRIAFTSGADQALHLRWEWRSNPDNSNPECRVFYCTVPEKELLSRGLFLENEIRSYIFDKLPFNITSPDVREKMEQYAIQNASTSGMLFIQRAMNDKEDRLIPVTAALNHTVFLVCVYDGYRFLYRIVAPGVGMEIPYRVVKQGGISKLLGNLSGKGSDRICIKLQNEDNRMKVARLRVGRSTLYMALPEETSTYYFDKDLDLSGLKIYYLSSLIGMTDDADR